MNEFLKATIYSDTEPNEGQKKAFMDFLTKKYNAGAHSCAPAFL